MTILKTKGEKYVSGKCIILFPHFKEAYSFQQGDTPKYQCIILIDKESEEEKIFKTILTKEWRNAGLTKTDFSPLRDGDKKAQILQEKDKNGEVYENRWFVKCASRFPIKVYTLQGRLWEGEDNEINGYIGRVSCQLKAYSSGLNNGVTAYLKGVQLIEEGISFGYDVRNDFDFDESKPDTIVDDEGEELPF